MATLQTFGGGTTDFILDPGNGAKPLPNAPYTVIDGVTMLPASGLTDANGIAVTQLTSDADGRYAGSALLEGSTYWLDCVGSRGPFRAGPQVSTTALAEVVAMGPQLNTIAASAAASAFSAKQAQAAAEAVQTGAATTDASKLTTGTVPPARLPDLSGTYATKDASSLTSGTLPAARIPDLSATYAVTNDVQNTVIGSGAAAARTANTTNNEAVGRQALQALARGSYNTAVGYSALYSLNGDGVGFNGTRNTAVGSNTQRFNLLGYNNISMGRNSMQCNTTGYSNLAFGVGSMAGSATVGFSGNIENQTPTSGNSNVAVGTSTLEFTDAVGNVAVGHEAGRAIKKGGSNTAVGYQALTALESGTAFNGKTLQTVALSPTYVFAGTSINLTLSAHGLIVGDLVNVTFGAREAQYLAVTAAPTANTFTVETRGYNVGTTETGTATIDKVVHAAVPAVCTNNTALGSGALGSLSAANSANNTALGWASLKNMADGSAATAMRNSTGVGHSAAVSGDGQLQLGNVNTVVYSQQAISIRSDARDKADVRDTALGLDFIEALRPVDYKYDFRQDYFEYDDDGRVVATPEPDGSKKRTRYHHGLIAQELRDVIAETGVDFGGFQDHTVNGGNDVLTVAYEELIGPLIKAVQELSAEVKALKAERG